MKKENKGHENLIPLNKLTEEKKKEIVTKGGKASGEARRRKKLLKECFEALLDSDVKNEQGETITGSEQLALAIYEKALKGDTKAFEIIRDTAGEKPIEVTQNTNINHNVELTDEQIDKILNSE